MTDDQIADRSTVENDIPLGNFRVSFQGVSEFWLEGNRPQLLGDYILDLRNQLLDKKQLFASHLLKLVIVTSNIPEVAKYWGEQVGLNGKTTQHELGGVAGKIIFWGDGEIEATYAVMILHEEFAIIAIHEDLAEYQEVAKRIIAHELAHIDTSFIYKSLFGNEELDQWTDLHRWFSDSIWGEFHAESISHKFADDFDGDRITEMFTEMLSTSIDKINNETKLYRVHSDVIKLIRFVVDQLRLLISQTGRCLGSLHAHSKDEFDVEWFFSETGKISKDWEDISRRVYAILMDSIISKEDYQNLGEVIMEYYHSVGVIPELLPDGTLYIRVPYTDETMPDE